MKKGRKKEGKPKINLILSHVNHTFFILNPQIRPHTFRHAHYILEKNVFFCDAKKGPIEGSICFKLVPGFLVPEPLS
jgi:hypothetical protein